MSSRKAARAEELLRNGAQRLQEGQTAQARMLCEEALQLAPRHPDALHLLGVLALQRADHAQAVELLSRAVALRRDDSAYRTHLAYALVGLQRLPEALTEFERAARLDPRDPDVHLAIGNCLAMMGRLPEAEAAFRRLIEREPRHVLGWFNLANALKDRQRYEDAREAYLRAIALAPRLAEAHCNLGVLYQHLERFDEAEQALRASLAIQPDFAAAWVNLAVTLNCQRQHEEAEALCRRALALDPPRRNAWPVLARSLAFQHRWGEAVQCYRRSVREFPESSDTFGALGNALAFTGRMDEAMAAFERATAIGEVSVHTRFAKAVALFSAGRMAEGAAEYAGRHERSAFVDNHPERPLTARLPDDIAGQTVCLHGEQGLGDEVFFLRFASRLKARGCRVVYHANPKLVSLLTRCAALDRVLPNVAPFADADHVLFVGDLLAHFLAAPESSPWPAPAAAATGWAARLPRCSRAYWPQLAPPLALAAEPQRVAAAQARLRQLGPPPYAGVTWRAGTGPQDQRGHYWALFKEVPLEGFAGALHGYPGTLVSLQRRPPAGETERLATLAGKPVHDWSAANDDLEEMLALLTVLDDYIGVSNTNMHLRAGTGRPARVLVPWPAEWRWLHGGTESPWFPGFPVYRQDAAAGWTTALTRLARDLQAGSGDAAVIGRESHSA